MNSFRTSPLQPKQLVVFAVLAIFSAALGLVSHQSLAAIAQNDPNPPNVTTQQMGSSTTGVSSMGQVGGTETMGNIGGPVPTPPTPTPQTKQASIAPKPAAAVPIVIAQTSTEPVVQEETALVVALATPQPQQADTGKETTAQPQPAPQAEALPHTGPANVAGLFVGSGAVGFAGHQLYLRRKR